MKARLQKLEQVRELIFDKLISSILKDEISHSKALIIETFIMLKQPNILIIGKNSRFILNDFNNRRLKDALNLLYQYGFITKYEKVCGDVFRVNLVFPQNDQVRVIYLNKIKHLKVA